MEKREEIRFEAAKKINKIICRSKIGGASKNITGLGVTDINNVKRKIEEGNAKIVPADKSNATVILLESDLNKKVHEFFEKNDVTEIKDKTQEYNKTIKTLISNSSVIPPDKQKQLYNTKASAPLFKTKIKTHKESQPIRPVINCMNAPSYKLSKYLCSLIKRNIQMDSTNTCTNSVDFINKIKQTKIDTNDILISVDIDNMYANIPKQAPFLL